MSGMINQAADVLFGIIVFSAIISISFGMFYLLCVAPIDLMLDGKLSEIAKRFLSKRKETNYLRKLVGRKAYKKFLQSEDQVSHAFDYLINVYPEHEEYLKRRKNLHNIQELSKYILEKQQNKKLPKVWI